MEVCLGSVGGSVGVRWKAYRSFSGVGQVSLPVDNSSVNYWGVS